MKKGFFGSLTALCAGAGILFAQAPDHGQKPEKLPHPIQDKAIPDSIGLNGTPIATSPVMTCGEACGCCESNACPYYQAWATGEYLRWCIKDSQTPPLVTTSPASSGGIIGNDGTTILYGGSIDNDTRWGGRFSAGFWLDECKKSGVEVSYFFLSSDSVNFQASGDGGEGSPALARPFFNVLTNAEDAQIVSFPGAVAGRVATDLSSRLWGAEANCIHNLCCCDDGCSGYLVEGLAGFRYLELKEGLGISEDLLVFPTDGGTGSIVQLRDQFDATNKFYGGQIGIRGEVRRGQWFANAVGKVALGGTHQTVYINGNTVIAANNGGPVTQAQGGLLALPTNIGKFNNDSFAVVPEVGLNIGYQFSDNLRAYVGYNYLYWSDVARPGDQIDRQINPSQLPTNVGSTLTGPAFPLPTHKETDFWAQGISFGIAIRY